MILEAKPEELKAYFNRRCRDPYWYKHTQKKTHKHGKTFGTRAASNAAALISVYDLLKEKHPDSQVTDRFPRTIGYQICGTKGIPSGLMSVKRYFQKQEEPNSKGTADHLLGSTRIGDTVHTGYVYDCNRTINVLKDKWLYENLWLFMTIELTTAEHDILKGFDYTIDQKLNLIHYKEAGIEIVQPEDWNIKTEWNKFFEYNLDN